MMRKGTTFGRSLAIGVTVSALLIGCGSDDSGSDSDGDGLSTSELVEILVKGGAPEDEAQCVAESIEGEYTSEDLQKFIDSTDGEGVNPELVEEIAAALGDCIG